MSTSQSELTTPAVIDGPNAGAIVFGLICLVVAVGVIVRETAGWTVNWSVAGPGVIVAAGAVFLVVGALGLVRRSR